MKRRGRLSEIATSLGVSPSTVSRAFRRPDLVPRRDTSRESSVLQRKRICGAPSGHPSAKVATIALIVPDLENPFFTVLAKSVMNEVGRQDISLIVADTNEDPLAEGEIIAGAARRAQGLIIASSRLAQSEIAAFRDQASIVLINREVEGFPSVSIYITHRACARRWSISPPSAIPRSPMSRARAGHGRTGRGSKASPPL